MKSKITPRWVMIKLTGLLFTAYAAYNLFILVRDIPRGLSYEGIFISTIVALMFSLLAVITLTSEVQKPRYVMIRRIAMVIVLFVLFALKLRMVGRIIAYVDFSVPHTILYGSSYFVILAMLLVLLVYCLLIRQSRPLHPVAAIALPVSAIVFAVCGLVLEAVLYFVYGIGVEASPLRMAVSRPVFYLSFICLSIYLLYPPQTNDNIDYDPPDDSELIAPDDGEYIPPEGSENIKPDGNAFVIPDDGEYIPPEGSENIKPDGNAFVIPDDEYIPPEGGMEAGRPDGRAFVIPDDEYIPPEGGMEAGRPDGKAFVIPDDGEYVPPEGGIEAGMPGKNDFVIPDDGEYVPPKGSEAVKPGSTDFVISDNDD